MDHFLIPGGLSDPSIRDDSLKNLPVT